MEIKGDLYRCTKCFLFQTKDSFHKKNNKLGIRSSCKICRGIERTKVYTENKDKELEYCRIYKQNNLEKRKETGRKSAAKNLIWFRGFLNEVKNVPCMDCGNIFSPCAMDFDHRNYKEKLFNISEGQCKNEDILLQEIAKCDIVCANCHRTREHNRRHIEISNLSKIINPFKNAPCADCNVQYSAYVMDFDHRDPEDKLFNISKPHSQNKEAIAGILLEINKCDVVCANCHRIRTFVKVDKNG